MVATPFTAPPKGHSTTNTDNTIDIDYVTKTHSVEAYLDDTGWRTLDTDDDAVDTLSRYRDTIGKAMGRGREIVVTMSSSRTSNGKSSAPNSSSISLTAHSVGASTICMTSWPMCMVSTGS